MASNTTDKLTCRGATTAEKLRGPRFGSQLWGACAPRPVKGRAGCWVREGLAPSRCEGRGVLPVSSLPPPPKIFENSDAESCILVTTCCEISCLKTTAKKLGHQYIVGRLGDQSPSVHTVIAPMLTCSSTSES